LKQAGEFNSSEYGGGYSGVESEMALLINQLLGYYKIIAQIGKGGMGEVYLAKDIRLSRNVGLKILPQQFTEHKSRLERFVQEAQTASVLNHPNIITIYDIGQIDGQYYIATEYITGQTLRRHLDRGKLSITEALNVAIQVADALAVAHRAGIIHRDIKPENLMVRSDGLVKVLDFGLAKYNDPQFPKGNTDTGNTVKVNTDPGCIIGTVDYMSPEQTRGQDIDQRSDIFSFGVVLYEMLTGCNPFDSETSADVIASILKVEPQPLTNFSKDIPEELQHIVERAIAKNREERYQEVKYILFDLKRLKSHLELVSGGDDPVESHSDIQTLMNLDRKMVNSNEVVDAFTGNSVISTVSSGLKRYYSFLRHYNLDFVILVIAVCVYIGIDNRFFDGNNRIIDSIAVLPLASEGGDPNLEYLSEGISETIINNLSQLPNLKVISRASAFHYRGQNVDPGLVGRELNVRAVLVGQIAQNGENLSISFELVDAHDKSRIWGRNYKGRSSDLIIIQSEISREVSNSLQLKHSYNEKRAAAKNYTDDPEAYQLYLKGLFHWNKMKEDEYKKSIEYYNQALERDPNYALAYAGLSFSYATLGANFLPAHEIMPIAFGYAKKALEIDETLADAHYSLAVINFAYYWNWVETERELKRVLELNPNHANAFNLYSHLYKTTGRLPEAIETSKWALELDPLSVNLYFQMANTYIYASQYDQAIERFNKTLILSPDNYLSYEKLGLVYFKKRKYVEALAMLNKAKELSKGEPSVIAMMGCAYAASGREREARAILEQIEQESKTKYIQPLSIAALHAALEQKNEAFEWLEKAYKDRNTEIILLKTDPLFDNLRSDPRFADLLRRIGVQ
jgi:eukaryotic-like serine/threonine-protein kinase